MGPTYGDGFRQMADGYLRWMLLERGALSYVMTYGLAHSDIGMCGP